MRSLSNVVFSLLIALIALSSRGFASETVFTDDFAVMAAKAGELCRKPTVGGCQNVIAAYDIDNTLLQWANPDQELGSDQWFSWQSSLLPPPGTNLPPGEGAVAKNFPDLLATFQSILRNFPVAPVDPRSPQIVTQLQNAGIQSLVLTARSNELRSETEAQLASVRYAFTRKPLPAGLGVFTPEFSELTPAQITQFHLGSPRPASYVNGILMVAGQHKGAMLRNFIGKMQVKPKAIVFIDDTPKNIIAMREAFEGTGIDVVAIQYTKTYPRVFKFFESHKSVVGEELQKFLRMPNKR